MSVHRLDLTPSPHRLVYRAVEQVLRNDATLRATVRTWSTWSGSHLDRVSPGLNSCPFVQLAPMAGPDEFYGPSGMVSTLSVHVGVATAGTNADDLFDLYQAIRRALYPADASARSAIRKALVAAGALHDDEPAFTQGRFGLTLDDDGAFLVGQGQLTIKLRTIDP